MGIEGKMVIKVDIPDYSLIQAIDAPFQDGSVIKVRCDETDFVISANEAGLYSLAIHLLELSQKEAPIGSHIHYSGGYMNGISPDSNEFIIEKI